MALAFCILKFNLSLQNGIDTLKVHPFQIADTGDKSVGLPPWAKYIKKRVAYIKIQRKKWIKNKF